MALLYRNNGKPKVSSNTNLATVSESTRKLRDTAFKKAEKNSSSMFSPVYDEGGYLPESANKPVMYKNILQPKTNSYKVIKFKKGSKKMC